MKAIDRLNDQDVLALYRWVGLQGRFWRTHLDHSWIKAGERVLGYEPQLQSIRNDLDKVQALRNVTATDIINAAVAIVMQKLSYQGFTIRWEQPTFNAPGPSGVWLGKNEHGAEYFSSDLNSLMSLINVATRS